MPELTQKNFNKGLNLLIGFFTTFGIICMYVDLHRSYPEISPLLFLFAVAILCTIGSFRHKFPYRWAYPLLIIFFPLIGLSFFWYESLKYVAKAKGRNIDTPKGILFWIVFSLIILLSISVLLIKFHIIAI